jgi:hypothetical protein
MPSRLFSAFVLVIGEADRFGCGKQIASYLGLAPEEDSSAERRRLGHISKQGNVLLRYLLVEAAQVTVRCDPRWRSQFFHLAMRRGRKIALNLCEWNGLGEVIAAVEGNGLTLGPTFIVPWRTPGRSLRGVIGGLA